MPGQIIFHTERFMDKKAESKGQPKFTVIDESQWVPCTPDWIAGGGDCASAPRLWCGAELNHYHPKVSPVRDRDGRTTEDSAAESGLTLQIPMATVGLGAKTDALGSRMTFITLTDAGRALPPGKHDLYIRPQDA